MAKKKKSASGLAPLRKALAGIEKTQRELQLNIKSLKAAMGHIHTPGTGKGHVHSASGKGHVHSASAKGHTHTASAKGHTHTAS